MDVERRAQSSHWQTDLWKQMGRRRMLRGGAIGLTGAGAALLFGCGDDDDGVPSQSAPQDEPPEVTTITLPKQYIACQAPLLAAKQFLIDEGFAQVNYSTLENKYNVLTEYLGAGKLDMAFGFACDLAYAVDQGAPLVVLGGAHVGCFEIFASDAVSTLADLRGKKVGILARDPDEGDFVFVSSVLQYIGISPGTDVELVAVPLGGLSGGAFDNGRIDALFCSPPDSITMRSTNQGHVVLSSVTDAPWSQGFCCLIATNREYLERNPVATKRALRAILRGVDLCAREPEAVANRLDSEAWVRPYIYALESMKLIPFDAWRSNDPADALRFYSLRLREAGLIGSTPEEVVEHGTDLRFFNELKEELAFAPWEAPLRAGLLNCDTNVAGPLALAPTAGREPSEGVRT